MCGRLLLAERNLFQCTREGNRALNIGGLWYTDVLKGMIGMGYPERLRIFTLPNFKISAGLCLCTLSAVRLDTNCFSGLLGNVERAQLPARTGSWLTRETLVIMAQAEKPRPRTRGKSGRRHERVFSFLLKLKIILTAITILGTLISNFFPSSLIRHFYFCQQKKTDCQEISMSQSCH